MVCSQICCVSVGLKTEVRMGELKVRLEVSVEM
jgi:hypothetical protein